MKLTRHIQRSLFRLMMAVALFAQWIAPASAYAVTPVAQVAAAQAVAGMPCHTQASGSDRCIMHCSQADQASLDHVYPAVPPAATAAWRIAVPEAPALASGARIGAEPPLAAGPPLPILYCSLLN